MPARRRERAVCRQAFRIIPTSVTAAAAGVRRRSARSPSSAFSISALDMRTGMSKYDMTLGGEIQALLSSGLAGAPLLTYFQLFNGPVVDRDGFIDGTCNYRLGAS